MFQTNPPEFDAARDDSSTEETVRTPSGNAPHEQSSASQKTPKFATLDAFAQWLDAELANLESSHEGFETVSSVRGFYGR